jgi:hypothetical protein
VGRKFEARCCHRQAVSFGQAGVLIVLCWQHVAASVIIPFLPPALQVLEAMWEDSCSLVLTPQAFSNINPRADIFNNINQQVGLPRSTTSQCRLGPSRVLTSSHCVLTLFMW